MVTGSDFRFIVVEQLAEIGVDPGAIMIEPEGPNTAPAILAAALYLHGTDPDAMMLVCPSDHLIPDDDGFRATVLGAQDAANAGRIVTFGIHPTYPETGYGYLELAADTSGDVVPLVRFIEKPDADTAATLVASDRYMWNAGIFLFKAATIIEAFKTHCTAMLEPVQTAVTDAQVDLGFLRLAPAPWRALKTSRSTMP